jgi:hypothetical protein
MVAAEKRVVWGRGGFGADWVMRATGRGILPRLLAGLLLAVLVSGCAAAAGSGGGDETKSTKDGENPHVWRPRTESVAVFKNGLGFFMREGEVALRDGWCVAEAVPPAAFGTLAIYAVSEDCVVDIVGSGSGELVEFDDRDAPDTVEARKARLEASRNLNVELQYERHDRTLKAAGKLVSVGPEFVILQSDTGDAAVPLAAIETMQVLDLPLRIHVHSEGDEPPKKVRLGMAYLRKGVTWIPEYTLNVIDEETAELSLRGTVVNEAEDLIHSDVRLVVGVPHFVHTNYMAPIAVGQTIRHIGAAVASQMNGVPQQVMTQVMNRAAIVQNAAPTIREPVDTTSVVESTVDSGAGNLQRALGDLPQLGGAAATDYTVYTKEDLTLRRGEKAILTLMTRKIRYSHIYHWTPPRQMNHALLLHNTTDSAWTTGPCLVLSDGRPLSEDLLRYTPRGATGELPVTAAINIAHSKTEREVDRKLKAHHVPHNVYFDLVTLEGELRLHNYEDRPVLITVDNIVPGKPIFVDDDGRMAADPNKLKIDQREGRVSWRITLEPDERRTLRYKYERYVRSN